MGLRIVGQAATSFAPALLLVFAGCAGARTPPPAAAAAPASNIPRLVVILTVDQMRADYVDRFKDDWTQGLKRLVDRGAWFRQAAFPYLNTVTCVGHATIATGALPRTHGVVQNSWWDRELGRLTTCTSDPAVRNIGYNAPVAGGDSAFRLLTPTFSDRMRTARGARVVSLALKARSAIMSAGRGGEAVTWLTDAGDSWVTSTAFTDQPVAAVRAFVDANPIEADFGKTWTRLLPPARYAGADDGEGEHPPAGWTRSFPHELTGKAGAPDAQYRSLWQSSPFADAYMGRFASALVESMRLGQTGTTDVLNISFSSPDLVGHAFGPASHEVQDVYARLDATIGSLLDRLDAFVGAGGYIVALTSDHGVLAIPEQLQRAGREGGRLTAVAVRKVVEQRVQEAVGEGAYVARVNGNEVYFAPGMYAKIAATPGAIDHVIAGIAGMPGVATVYRAEQLRGSAPSSDPMLHAAALSHFADRSGDLVIVPKPGWSFATLATTHATAESDNQRVPIVLMGPGIRPGVYVEPVTPADIAPTLAVLAGIALPAVEGRALREALTAAAAPPTHARNARVGGTHLPF